MDESRFRQLKKAEEMYKTWNEKINVISRKDIDQIETHHFLHSLAIARVISFKAGTKIMDIGTGGGFPGIPLAIIFPEAHFTLVDSIGKKIKVVNEIIAELKLPNVTAIHSRCEQIDQSFDYIVSRAVAPLDKLWHWTSSKVRQKGFNDLPNGLICLKGGDLSEEISKINRPVNDIEISSFFNLPFFSEKKILFVPVK